MMRLTFIRPSRITRAISRMPSNAHATMVNSERKAASQKLGRKCSTRLVATAPARKIRNMRTNSLDLARHVERWGYRRFWLAEHHNMIGIASAATSVVIGHVAGGTQTIRVGSGGIMLPNHAPLMIAEQFGTLESLYPGRIDLGLGRAPGTDGRTLQALRRN